MSKRYWYKIEDKEDLSKENGVGGLNDLMRPFGSNIIAILKELEETHNSISLDIDTDKVKIQISGN